MRSLCLVAVLSLACTHVSPALADEYLVGRGMADITGPPVGVKMLGYVRPDQISEGLHLRQYAKAFVIVEPATKHRLAIVVTDLQSVTHSLVLSVLDRLHEEFGDAYRLDNTIISATHTHAVPGGYWQYAADTAFGSPFHPEHFDALVDGIAQAISAAHRDLAPGRIFIGQGDVEGAGAQRSGLAYLNNPESERQKYAADVDKQMILLRFERDGRPIGALNWHAVHPTSMTFDNKLISSDNKGYAAYAFTRSLRSSGAADERFVGAFAQSNCGDVTPHLDLKGVGPGKDDFEGTQIIGGRMADAALRLFAGTNEELHGPLDARQSYVDMGNVAVSDKFTHAGEQRTCAGAYGYSFAAGSTEDGGGQPIFREGMTRQEPFIEALARTISPLPAAPETMRIGQRPKPILLAVGAVDPPAMPQVLPIGVARIGQLALAIGPAEYTTMSGRRFRGAIREALPAVKYVAVAGYTGDYAGYVATRDEYELQHYEGAATLFGPWTQAAYEQEFARLASDVAAGRESQSHEPPFEMRGTVRPTPLGTAYDQPPADARFGDVVHDAPEECRRGDTVTAVFWSGNPRNAYRPDRRYAAIQRQIEGKWQTVAVAGDWELKCRWTQPRGASSDGDKRLAAHHFAVAWDIPPDAPPGVYRIVHDGVYKTQADDAVHEFETASRSFQVQ